MTLFTLLKNRIFKEGFVRNVFLLSSGASLNIILNIALTPVVTRLYNRADYGLASLFASVVSIAVLVVTCMYPSAIVIPRERTAAYNLVRLSFILVFLFILVGGVLYFSGVHTYFISVDISAYKGWAFLLPLALVIITFDQTTASLNIRDKEFKRNAKSNVATSVLNKAITIVAGLIFGSAHYGIIAGFLISHFTGALMRLNKSFKDAVRFPWNMEEVKQTAIHYINYPKYILPGDFINRFSRDSPIYFFTIYNGMDLVGSFAFAVAMLNIPYSVIGASISPVFIQKAGELRDQTPERLGEFVTKINKSLFLIGIMPFAILVVFGGEIFSLVFSAQWKEAGVFAGFLSIYFLFRLVTSPMSSIFRVLEKERITLIFNIFLFVGRIATLFVASYFYQPQEVILAFSIFSAVAYAILMILTFRLVKLPWLWALSKYILLFYATVGVLLLLRQAVF